jgi:hypothetical protein
MPGIDFNALRQEISTQQVWDLLGFEPTTRTGAQLHGPCPVHGSTVTQKGQKRRGTGTPNCQSTSPKEKLIHDD